MEFLRNHQFAKQLTTKVNGKIPHCGQTRHTDSYVCHEPNFHSALLFDENLDRGIITE
jgi:hypothetical protein